MNNYRAGCGRRFWLVGIEPLRHWPPLARAVGHPEWINDNRFADPRSRAANATELIAELDAIFGSRTLEEWAEEFAKEPELFWAPINDPEDLLGDPAFHSSGSLVEVPDESTGTLMISTPVDFHGSPWAPRGTAPSLGQHTAEVLSELGRTPEEVQALIQAGVVVVSED